MKPKEYWVVRDGEYYINEHGGHGNRKEAYRYSYRDAAYASAGAKRSHRVVHVTVKPRAKGFELPKGDWWAVRSIYVEHTTAVFHRHVDASKYAQDSNIYVVEKVTVK